MKKMKRFFMVIAAALIGVQGLYAQRNIFDHVAVGVSAGLEGYGFEVAAPVTDYFAIRAGMSMLPNIKVSGDVNIDNASPSFTSDKVKVEAKLNKKDYKVLLDIHPIKTSSFRITTGAYFGPEKMVTVYNTEQFLDPSEWGRSGIKLGDYRVTSDEKGNVQADLKVKSVKPYVGIGFGRAVPKKRLSFNFDLGVQFWGEPGVWTNARDDFGNSSYQKLEKGDVDNKDADKVFDIMSKVVVYPVLSFRLNGRIF